MISSSNVKGKVKTNSKAKIKPKSQDIVISPEDIEIDLDLGHKVIKLADKLGAVCAEVFMVKGIETDFSIGKNTVNFASGITEFGMGIRVIKDHRVGFGYCTSLNQAEHAVKNAISTTKLTKKLEFELQNPINVY